MKYTEKMLRDDALKGKIIVITGGGSGLGKAMTRYFMELGAKVAITSRNLDKLKSTAQELEAETGSTCLPVQCDVRHYEQVESVLEKVLNHYGRVDVLLNNAAGNFISPTERLSANAFDTIIDIVLKGSKNCTLAFGKHWIKSKQEESKVLNIVTTYAWTGSGYVFPSHLFHGTQKLNETDVPRISISGDIILTAKPGAVTESLIPHPSTWRAI